MPTKISKVAKELNVGVQTLLEHLEKKNMPADQNSPNARISDEQKEILMQEFCSDYKDKQIATNMAVDRQKEKKGQKQTFAAVVSGDGIVSGDVEWSQTGGTKSSISDDGVLTVGSGETGSSITVTAKSKQDSSKTGTATVTVTT